MSAFSKCGPRWGHDLLVDGHNIKRSGVDIPVTGGFTESANLMEKRTPGDKKRTSPASDPGGRVPRLPRGTRRERPGSSSSTSAT